MKKFIKYFLLFSLGYALFFYGMIIVLMFVAWSLPLVPVFTTAVVRTIFAGALISTLLVFGKEELEKY